MIAFFAAAIGLSGLDATRVIMYYSFPVKHAQGLVLMRLMEKANDEQQEEEKRRGLRHLMLVGLRGVRQR